MLRDDKNLKDPERKPIASYGAGSQNLSVMPFTYTKTHKLITALYMVTDIIDKDEPLRNKLRTLGTEIISDTHFSLLSTCSKISEIMSFLDIASAINIISEMNCNILRKEFLKLDQSIKEVTGKIGISGGQVNLMEFFAAPLLEEEGAGGGNSLITTSPFGHSSSARRREDPKGHTRIGVQKGSTLLKAIKDMSNRNIRETNTANFDILKKQRREDILNIIKIVGGNVTIKDIKEKAQGALTSCSEKTLQRELISMVKGGVLNKIGEKRWSRYFLK